MSSSINRLYTSFGQWLSDWGTPRRKHQSFMDRLRRAVEISIPERDGQCEVLARDLRGSDGLRVSYADEVTRLFPGAERRLIVAVSGPDWALGWRDIFRDEFSSDYGPWFFHLARQYIQRGRIANILGALAIEYRRGVDFYGTELHAIRGGQGTQSSRSMLDEFVDRLSENGSRRDELSAAERRFTGWVKSINGLDPFVHRAVFQLVRARRLEESGFDEEAVTALDGVVSIAGQFTQDRWGAEIESRRDVGVALGMSQRDIRHLESLYKIRSVYGAHPSWSKWWDFSEMFESSLEPLYELVTRVFWRLVLAEQSCRRVAETPERWSEWFGQHCDVVFEAVWWPSIKW